MNSAAENIPSLPDRYEVYSCLGDGGMGVVYKAHDKILHKDVAIKLLKSTGDQQNVVRFQKEAKLLGQLSHERILSALDFGTLDDGSPYLVLDYLNGETLADYIQKKQHLSVAETLTLLVQIIEAMIYAHNKNILHRDLKPSNIMLIAKDEVGSHSVKIMDFGIAKLLRVEQEQSHQKLTTTGAGLGSPLYMSPEQAHGENIDKRSDIYSLGCIAFEMLTGNPPFSAKSALEVIQMKNTLTAPTVGDALPQSNCPEQLQTIVAKCLARQATNRYASFDEIQDELVRIIDERDQLTLFEPESPSEQKVATTSENTKIIFGVATLLTVAVVWAVGYAFIQPAPVPVIVTEHKGVLGIGSLPDETTISKVKVRQGNGLTLSDKTLTSEWLNKNSIGWPKTTRHIQIKRCKFESSLPNALAKFPISGISILDSELNDRGLENISQLKNLRELSLEMSLPGITAKTFNALAVLPMNRISIRQPKLTDKDLTAIARNIELTSLCVIGSGMTTDGLKELKSLSHLELLVIGEESFDPAFLDTIATFSSLHAVSVRGIRQGTIHGHLDKMAKLPSLKLLGFVKSSLNGEDLQSLPSFRQLETLSLDEVALDSSAMKIVLDQPTIKCIEIIGASQLSREQIIALAKKKGLNKFSLLGTFSFANDVEESIRESRPNLRLEIRG